MDDIIHLNCKDKNLNGLCYSCGISLCKNIKCVRKPHCKISYTRDHIPPKSFLEQHKGYKNITCIPPIQEITVPCCNQCNKMYSKYEENFLTYITTFAATNPIAEYAMRNKRIDSIEKNNKLKTEIISNIEHPIPIFTESRIFIGNYPRLKISDETFSKIKLILKKIAKGYYYKHTGKILTSELQYIDDSVFSKSPNNILYISLDKRLKNFIATFKKGIQAFENIKHDEMEIFNRIVMPDIFAYGFCQIKNPENSNEKVIIFYISFYNNYEFVLTTKLESEH